MDKFACIQTLVAVARNGSFSRAAQDLGISRATVTKHIRQLEDHYRSRFINRTTRELGVTTLGEAFVERCERLLQDLEDAELMLSSHAQAPSGSLRISAPTSLGVFHIAPLTAAFTERYPEVSVELRLGEHLPDLIAEKIDLAIAARELEDSTLVARRVASSMMRVCGSPAYFERRGYPERPQELAAHNCLVFTGTDPIGLWPFRSRDGEFTVAVSGDMSSNVGDALRMAALKGRGLIWQPGYMVDQDIAAGRLVSVLDEYAATRRPIYAVYVHRKYVSPKVRLFIDYLVEHLRGPSIHE